MAQPEGFSVTMGASLGDSHGLAYDIAVTISVIEVPMSSQPRKRRPPFDREAGVAIAQDLFHARGFDAVGVADLTQALEITPPSLYAAYGSKAQLFQRAMQRYADAEMRPLSAILSDDRNPADAVTELLTMAARQYTADPARLGCLVTEALGADDPTARDMAAEIAMPSADAIRAYTRQHFPERHDELADYVLMTLRGLSSFSRQGYSGEKLEGCVRTAAMALAWK